MNRKPKLAPRNPHVVVSLFKKAGKHTKPHKAQRRADKMALEGVAHGQSIRLLPGRREFEPLRPHHQETSNTWLARAAHRPAA